MSATGRYSLPLDHMRTLLANSATFRTLVSAADVAAAKGSIFISEAEMTAAHGQQRSRPWAIVGFNSFALTRTSTTGWKAEGPLEVVIEATMPSGDQAEWQTAGITWQNKIGAMIDEMADLVVGSGEYLNVTEFAVVQCGIADECDHNGATVLGAVIVVDWRGA